MFFFHTQKIKYLGEKPLLLSDFAFWWKNIWPLDRRLFRKTESVSENLEDFKLIILAGFDFNPSLPRIPEKCNKVKINLNVYFHTSLWCLWRFYEGLHKTFWSTKKKCEDKNLS